MGRAVARPAASLPDQPVDKKSHFCHPGLTTGRGPGGRFWVLRLDWRPLMAVPKRKTSKSRRDKRRATHALEAPRVNTCPQCGSPKRAHRICPTCGTYKGREVEPLRLQAP
jgi:large subunit ribosomal protein L32